MKLDYHNYELEEKLIRVKRVSKTIKGGRIASFTALSIVGNKNGIIGIGYGKSKDIKIAIDKSIYKAKNNLNEIKFNKTTIFYPINIKKKNINIFIKPSYKETGIVAGGAAKHLIRLIGIKNIFIKIYGSTCPHIIVKILLEAFLKTKSIYKKNFYEKN